MVAIGFALGALAHFTSWVLLWWGIEVYGHGYHGWRHPTFTVVDAFIAWVAVRFPAWLALPLALFAAEQTWDHGFGPEPVVVAIAALLSAWGVVRMRR
jgi:hypothetical protein